MEIYMPVTWLLDYYYLYGIYLSYTRIIRYGYELYIKSP